ncbi:hypothetical protein LMG26846_03252 [Achromobacter insuavis]|uniref:cytochrome c-type biogenesis protein n=1 Tax=Achromobacter insuavis TaxID=1287735 RepID=UPI0014691445|nr:cytochrome c-type biogenesis protein [Achromobacter insuavis]CAB3876142.1 hypothetical protein LMG26846_03252 [Achromobacter insuavis]
MNADRAFSLRPGLRAAPSRRSSPARHRARAWATALALTLAFGAQAANEAPAAAPDPALEARVQAFTRDLRCLVCQNESLADSRAPLARDLRREVRELFLAGRSEAQVRQFLVSRYGDFVLYDPPLKASTALLWTGPGLLLAAALGGLLWRLRRHARHAEAPLGQTDAAEARTLLADEAAPRADPCHQERQP